MNVENELLKNLDRLHTTELGVVRIKKNLSLETNDVVNWCKTKIESPNAIINRKGKNWYISVYDCITHNMDDEFISYMRIIAIPISSIIMGNLNKSINELQNTKVKSIFHCL